MSFDIPTREEFIEHIIKSKRRANINITIGVYKRAAIEADKAKSRGEIKAKEKGRR